MALIFPLDSPEELITRPVVKFFPSLVLTENFSPSFAML
jgi:hypothetical protein